MPNIKEVKNRIGSVKSTQQLTKAMKMVAAAKLRRAQESAESSRPYSDTMNEVIGSISNKVVSTSSERNLLTCLLYTSPSPRDGLLSRMPSSA